MRTIVWFRDFDLRLADHLPLSSAAAGEETIPVFVFDPEQLPLHSAHQTQFLADCIEGLSDALASLASRLVVLQGATADALRRAVEEWGVGRVVAHVGSTPAHARLEEILRTSLGSTLELFDTNQLVPRETVRTKTGQPFSVYTYFARTLTTALPSRASAPAPQRLPFPNGIGVGAEATFPPLSRFGFSRQPALVRGGEAEAHQRLQNFLESRVTGYAEGRDRMDMEGTSRLSADLRFGTLSARQVWNALAAMKGEGAQVFRSQLVWREFAYSTLADRPELTEHPFRPEWDGFPWREDDDDWEAWVVGRTGYPIVDAAARQLLGEGFVHNRARMISASFLTKHLLLPYWQGEQHYMEQLVDGDTAQNNLGWQWSAGCGCDAQPYFRVFNPMTQGKKFDPDGAYVRRWLPELGKLPSKFIHAPWEAPDAVLEAAGIRLGEDYPRPIVDHRFARERFLNVAQEHLRAMRG